MASSSSSSSPVKKYHVFPSFHSPDVRKGFLSHLHKYFTIRQINAFKDQEMERGNTIGQAIREATVSIVLISKNYASSSCLLDELVEILKCKEDLGQIVLPVFYEVDPSDVRKQRGDFGIVFHNSCVGRTEEDRKRWSKALADVATIAGEDSKNWTDEAAMLEKLCTDVSHKLKAELLKEQFRRLDRDQTGLISVPGLRFALEFIGEKITDHEVKEMTRDVDLDGDGRLNYDEFSKVVMAKMSDEERAKAKKFATDVTLSKEEEEEFRALFIHGDIDQNGFLTESEFRYVMTEKGHTITDEQVKEAIGVADVDGDGQLSYDEFAKLMIQVFALKKKLCRDAPPLSKEEEEEMRGKFMAGDVNKDGFLTVEELQYVVTKGGAKITEEDAKRAIQAADSDGDGRLSYDEFVKCMRAVNKIEEYATKNLVTEVKLSSEDEKRLRDFFLVSDIDMDGFITAAELQHVWKNDENTYEDACWRARRFINLYDVDGDGRLNYDEYVKAMLAVSDDLPNPVLGRPLRKTNDMRVKEITASVSKRVNRFVKFVVETLF